MTPFQYRGSTGGTGCRLRRYWWWIAIMSLVCGPILISRPRHAPPLILTTLNSTGLDELKKEVEQLRRELEQTKKRTRHLGFVDHVQSAATNQQPRTCPCCGWTGPKFAFHDSGVGRDDAKCPQCKSLERHRNSCAFLGSHPEILDVQQEEKALTEQSGSARVIYFGPHPPMGKVLDESTYEIDHIWVDYNEKMYNYGDTHKTLHADVQNLQFPDNFAHGVMLLHVLEHVPDLDTSFNELKRILKPNGWLMIEVPSNPTLKKTVDCRGLASNEERKKGCGHPDHQWNFAQKEFEENVLGKNNLDCTETSTLIVDRVGQKTHDAFQVKANGRLLPQYFCRSNKGQ